MSKKFFILKMFLISLFLFELIFGFIEVYYLIKYYYLNGRCNKIFEWISVGAVINILCSIACFYIVMFNNMKNKFDCDNCSFLMKIQLSQILVSTWSSITYFNIDGLCKKDWIDNAPELWDFVIVHFLMEFLVIIVICILIICCFLTCCGIAYIAFSDIESSDKEINKELLKNGNSVV